MLGAGVAWGVYSIRGKAAGDATCTTAGNFLRATPLAVGLNLAMLPASQPATLGIACAMASGAVTSGIGYAIWYSAIRGLRATHAATVQLSVPVIAAAGGIVFLDEAISARLVIASAAILGGVAFVVIEKPSPVDAPVDSLFLKWTTERSPPDLAGVVDAWDSLPPDTRTAILAIVEATGKG